MLASFSCVLDKIHDHFMRHHTEDDQPTSSVVVKTQPSWTIDT